MNANELEKRMSFRFQIAKNASRDDRLPYTPKLTGTFPAAHGIDCETLDGFAELNARVGVSAKA